MTKQIEVILKESVGVLNDVIYIRETLNQKLNEHIVECQENERQSTTDKIDKNKKMLNYYRNLRHEYMKQLKDYK